MDVGNIHSYFNNDELGELQQAFNGACEELGLGLSPAYALERGYLATMIIHLARSGESNVEVIQKRAVLAARNAQVNA